MASGTGRHVERQAGQDSGQEREQDGKQDRMAKKMRWYILQMSTLKVVLCPSYLTHNITYSA